MSAPIFNRRLVIGVRVTVVAKVRAGVILSDILA